MAPGQLLIDGEWRHARDGATMVTTDPTTEDVITAVAMASPADVEDAIDAAHKAFENGVWSRMQTEHLARVLFKIADLIQEREEDFALGEGMDVGVPYQDFRALVIPPCVISASGSVPSIPDTPAALPSGRTCRCCSHRRRFPLWRCSFRARGPSQSIPWRRA